LEFERFLVSIFLNSEHLNLIFFRICTFKKSKSAKKKEEERNKIKRKKKKQKQSGKGELG
jgi:hypothetical protein